jgi:hypothetical protein
MFVVQYCAPLFCVSETVAYKVYHRVPDAHPVRDSILCVTDTEVVFGEDIVVGIAVGCIQRHN